MSDKIKKTIYPHATFVLQPDSITGIETVTLNSGDKLTIKNWGCKYYILTFCFETSRFLKDTTDLNFWFKSACGFVTDILVGLEASIDIKKGIKKLIDHIDNNKINNYENLKLDEEIDFGGNDIRSFVSVDRIETHKSAPQSEPSIVHIRFPFNKEKDMFNFKYYENNFNLHFSSFFSNL